MSIEDHYLTATTGKYAHLGIDSTCYPKADPTATFPVRIIRQILMRVEDDGLPKGQYYEINYQTGQGITLYPGDVIETTYDGERFELSHTEIRRPFERKFLAERVK